MINHYVGGGPISRTAAVIAPGAVVMAMIYAWGPLSGLHINPAVTFGFASRGVFPARWVVPYWVVRFAGAICAALFLQGMFGDVAAGGNYPITTPGGEWKSLVMLDIAGNDYTGWWVYIAGPVIGAAIAVMIIGLVRGLPDKEERAAAEGGALPILGRTRRRPSPEAQGPAGGEV